MLLHDPFWRPHEITQAARALGAAVVMVHHGSAALDAGAIPGPKTLYTAAFRSWLRRAYAPVDAVMAACDPAADIGPPGDAAAALRPRARVPPAPGRRRAATTSSTSGGSRARRACSSCSSAAALAEDPWPLWLIGCGTAEDAVAAKVRRLGLAQRVSVRPYVTDRVALARPTRGARCVVMPGAIETFGLVAFEAAACGAATVACATAPSARLLGAAGAHVRARRPGRAAGRDRARPRRASPTWSRRPLRRPRTAGRRAFDAELADLETLHAARVRRAGPVTVRGAVG